MANMPKPAVQIATERVVGLRKAAEVERARQEAEQQAALERWQEQKKRGPPEKPKWGTKEAKRRKIEHMRNKIETETK